MSRFPRLDILPAAQRRLWPKLTEVAHLSFVLYGGTAVALYLGHRESVDFDFFANRNFQPDELFGSVSFLQGAEVLQSQPNTLTVLTAGPASERVKLSFFGGLSFGRLAPPKKSPNGMPLIASLDDLLAHKLKTLLQRVELKDYLDIDALIHSGLSLARGLAGAQLLFPAFSAQECLKALTYFEDEPLRNLPPQVEERLLGWVKRVRTVPSLKLDSSSLAD
jgi:hypothetical protein